MPEAAWERVPVPAAELVAWWDEVDARQGAVVCSPGYLEVAAERLDDFALVELIAELEREASGARARQLVAVEVLSRRASMNPSWPVRVGHPNVTGEEVAARLGSSRAAGRELVTTARLFAGPLLATAAALEAGEIDWGKARIFASVLGTVAVEVAVDVQDRVLPTAGARTHGQLRRDLARALIVVDPVDAEQRAVRAVDTRRVCRPRVLADGMAGLWAVVPGAVAAGIDAALTAAARAGRNAGDPRTSDQLRADAFAGALLGCGVGVGAGARTCAGTPGTPGTTTPGATKPGATTCCASTAPGATMPGTATPGATTCCASTAPGATGGPTATGCTAGAAFGLPWSALAPGVGGVDGVDAASGVGGGIRVDVTVALSTLLGVDELPGELAGFGPITAQTARRLAAAGTWRRLVTDPLSGTVLDVGKRRYRPPKDLAEIVRARDRRCLSPVCAIDASCCDLDHRVPYAADGTGGATSAENLGSLCRRDHLIKTHAGWRIARDPERAGGHLWTTPTGHEYPTQPDPLPGHELPLGWDAPPPF
ncbi:HNH endonuclease signature motif containing protein [Pengzhenrongella frigida]|uniref:HNH endonuclease signature motif containing protein n=1 Tax=Pengzhenrongella frigida TaxID=1259133 RepID=UPI0013E9A769|nr:HNH endonuclease signature motif containing protein [Cellulomonas sp. HLT2-17]